MPTARGGRSAAMDDGKEHEYAERMGRHEGKEHNEGGKHGHTALPHARQQQRGGAADAVAMDTAPAPFASVAVTVHPAPVCSDSIPVTVTISSAKKRPPVASLVATEGGDDEARGRGAAVEDAGSASPSRHVGKSLRSCAAHTSPSGGTVAGPQQHEHTQQQMSGGGSVVTPQQGGSHAAHAARPAVPVAVSATSAAAAAAIPAGAGASASSGAAASAAYSSHVHAAQQQQQLADLHSLQRLSSFERCQHRLMRSLYKQMMNQRNAAVEMSLTVAEELHNQPPPPMDWRFPIYEPVGGDNSNFNFFTDIPGSTFMTGVPPGFYLPSDLKLGRNCREVRENKRRAALAAASAASAAVASAACAAGASTSSSPSASSAAAAAVASPSAASASTAAAAASSSSAPPLAPFVEWTLSQLLDTPLQSAMEFASVLNSWDEGSYLSVVRTDGDGNCLSHALLTAAYGCADSGSALRDAAAFELGSEARKKKYLERYEHEHAREIGAVMHAVAANNASASAAAATDAAAPSAAPAVALDADDRRSLREEFDRQIECTSNPQNYLSAIHIFAMAHVLRRPIIVYGTKMLRGMQSAPSAASTPTSSAAMSDAASTAHSAAGSAAAATAAPPSPSQQLNSIVGIYLPLLWYGQYKLTAAESKNNALLKPLCVLYSCADEHTGSGGHFSALVATDGMFPEPPMVPLQQWDGFAAAAAAAEGESAAAAAADAPSQLPPGSALPMLPVRFLLPGEQTPAMVHHLLNKHLEVQQTAQGHWFAKFPFCRTQQYLTTGWEQYIQLARIVYAAFESGTSPAAMLAMCEPDPMDTAVAAMAGLSGGGGGGGLGEFPLDSDDDRGGDWDDMPLSSDDDNDLALEDEGGLAGLALDDWSQKQLGSDAPHIFVTSDDEKAAIQQLITATLQTPMAQSLRDGAAAAQKLLNQYGQASPVDSARLLRACIVWTQRAMINLTPKYTRQPYYAALQTQQLVWRYLLAHLPPCPAPTAPKWHRSLIAHAAADLNAKLNIEKCVTTLASVPHLMPALPPIPQQPNDVQPPKQQPQQQRQQPGQSRHRTAAAGAPPQRFGVSGAADAQRPRGGPASQVAATKPQAVRSVAHPTPAVALVPAPGHAATVPPAAFVAVAGGDRSIPMAATTVTSAPAAGVAGVAWHARHAGSGPGGAAAAVSSQPPTPHALPASNREPAAVDDSSESPGGTDARPPASGPGSAHHSRNSSADEAAQLEQAIQLSMQAASESADADADTDDMTPTSSASDGSANDEQTEQP